MKRLTMITLIFLFALTGVTHAKGRHSTSELLLPYGKWWHRPVVAEKLKLTSEEKHRLDELFLNSKRRMIDLRHGVQKERFELETILESPDFDESAFVERGDKWRHARMVLMAERLKLLGEVRKMLGQDRFRTLTREAQRHRHQRRLGRMGTDSTTR